jgi:hypothetical protein
MSPSRSGLLVVALAAMTGCGARTIADQAQPNEAQPTDRGDVDATVPEPIVEVGFPEDAVTDANTCPPVVAEGARCSGEIKCRAPDERCGGTYAVACRGGIFRRTSAETCAPNCPATPPLDRSGCPSESEGQVCAYWPTDGTCASCTCRSGIWSCTAPTNCPSTRAECAEGRTCAPNTGCGAGRCRPFCTCGLDLILRCSINPC